MSESTDGAPANPKSEPAFMMLKREDVAEASRQAQESFGAFHQAMIERKYPNAFFNIKANFSEADGREGANLWVAVSQIRSDGYLCEPFELPKGFTGLQPGQKVLLQPNNVLDWMIVDDGTLYGGYSLRIQRAHVPDERKSQYDEFLGVTTYSETLP